MNKIILICLALLLISSLAFANTSNSIQSFKVHYDTGTSQLTINAMCKAWNVATISLSNGVSRQITCETTGIVPQTMLIPVVDEGTPLTATLTITQPCDVCTMNANAIDGSTNNWGAYGMILGVIILVAIVFVAIFNKFGEHPRY